MNEEQEIIDVSEDDPQETIPYTYSITAYGADFLVDGLVNRMKSGDIFIPPFQRGYVWSLRQASRFIESLLLGLPVPGIFLSKEYESQKLLVIDGQQRLRSLEAFYRGLFKGKEFLLSGVQDMYEGMSYNSLKDEDRRRLDDSIVHAIIVKQDVPSGDQSSIYHIFERLNTGGMLLTAQEIRACIYHGTFNKLLGELNDNTDWRDIFGREDNRMKDQELILRFLALYYRGEDYKPPMKKFLNDFMVEKREPNHDFIEESKQLFLHTISTVKRTIGNRAFRPEKVLNAAVFDAVMVGIAKRLTNGGINNIDSFKKRYRELLRNSDFKVTYISGTSQLDHVNNRLKLATDAFKDID